MFLYTVAFYTLGCKVNQYETEAIKEQFLKNDFTAVDFDDAAKFADVYLINTCTVTSMSDRKSRQVIRRAAKHNPEAIVVVTGCYSQTSPEEVASIYGVDLVVGTSDRGVIVKEVVRLILERESAYESGSEAGRESEAEGGLEVGRECEVEGVSEALVRIEDISSINTFEPLSISNCEEKTRAFIKIQDGCENYCSYCKIPFARGPVRSRPVADVLLEAKRLVAAGFKEIVLTGIHLASYGKDFSKMDSGIPGSSLVKIIQLLGSPVADGLESLKRIRLGSIEPTSLSDEFVRTVAELPKVCPHFHVSLQSGCDNTLRRMNRRYTADEYFEAVERLRQKVPNVALTTDIIVGFPGETEQDFLNSYEFVKRVGFSSVHVFKFSARKGTAAAKMSGLIAPQIKEVRSEKMIALVAEMSQSFHQQMLGKTWDVLVEERKDIGLLEGHSTNFVKFVFEGRGIIQGDIVLIAAERLSEGKIIGKCV